MSVPINFRFFLETMSNLMDELQTSFDQIIIMGDFNESVNVEMFKNFINSYKLKNLIKTNTCFKSK